MLRRDDGVALISVLLTTVIVSLLATGVVINSMHANDSTTLDKHKETAFQAASAGVDDAFNCLSHLSTVTPISEAIAGCSKATSSATSLSESGVKVGQYATTVTDLGLQPGSTIIHLARVQVTGYAPAQSGSHAIRKIDAEVSMIPATGFFDALFAGGQVNVTDDGDLYFKNGGTVNGSVYAESWQTEKNGAIVGDLKIVGDVGTKNGDTYHSIWSGASLTVGENTIVQTTAKACGATVVGGSTSPGNASLGNGAQVAANLQYKGTLTMGNGASYGSVTQAPCSAPATLDIPTFTYDAANYAGWTLLTFTSASAANNCLATAGSTQVVQQANCGASLGDANGTIGKSASGTIIYVNVSNCASNVSLGSATFTGNFTLVSKCNFTTPNNTTWTKSANNTQSIQAAFIAINGGTGTGNITTQELASTDTKLAVLLYATGKITGEKKATLAAGAVYAHEIEFKNGLDVTQSTDLGARVPAGFNFDPSTATTYSPVVRTWRETGG